MREGQTTHSFSVHDHFFNLTLPKCVLYIVLIGCYCWNMGLRDNFKKCKQRGATHARTGRVSGGGLCISKRHVGLCPPCLMRGPVERVYACGPRACVYVHVCACVLPVFIPVLRGSAFIQSCYLETCTKYERLLHISQSSCRIAQAREFQQ